MMRAEPYCASALVSALAANASRRAAIQHEKFALLPLELFIEIKLASGMVAKHRGKDLVDIQELIKSIKLPKETVSTLHPWVREAFAKLWDLAQVEEPF